MAFVGVLNPDATVVADEERVAGRLVRDGYCIVSGLAFGCDTVGHNCTLEGQGKTVVFLPGPLNEMNPASNRQLADDIVSKGGLLVSEYYDTPRSRQAFLGRYVERDRLQAMFVRCVVLAASYDENNLGRDCGSRIALQKAKAYGVPRAAPPFRRNHDPAPMRLVTRLGRIWRVKQCDSAHSQRLLVDI